MDELLKILVLGSSTNAPKPNENSKKKGKSMLQINILFLLHFFLHFKSMDLFCRCHYVTYMYAYAICNAKGSKG